MPWGMVQQHVQHNPIVIRGAAGMFVTVINVLCAAQQDGDFADAPGNFGFDPLSLGSDPATLKWCVCAKHADPTDGGLRVPM